MQLDPDQFADIVANAIKLAIAPVVARIGVLERREAVPGPEGKPGRDGEAGPPGESVMGPTGPKGDPGKDADESLVLALRTEVKELREELAIKVVAPDASMVKALVAEELKAIPVPQNGKDGEPGAPGPAGKDADLDVVADLVKGAVENAVKAIPVPQNGKDGEPGVPGPAGKDADLDVVADLVKGAVENAVKAIPVPQNGQDGTSVTLDDVAPMVKTLVADAVAALPAPKDGAPGAPGQPVDPETVEALVVKHVAAIPRPKDGVSVTVADIEPVIVSEVQKAVAAIPVPKDGKDGVGLTGAFQSREGTLIITLSDGTTKDVGPIVGRDVDMADVTRQIREAIAAIPLPKDGRDGLDGVGFDDLELIEDDRGRPILRFVRGEKVREFRIDGAYCDVWKAGESYLKGDRVTWGGSLFIARQDTTDKPETSSAWRLAVKRGQEGKTGREGQKGIDGRPGRDGKDLTHLDPSTGRKY